MDLLMNSDYHDPETGDDRPLEDQEIVRMLAILLFGAIDTTSLAISGTIQYLATHPEAQQYLRENGVSKTAVEEMVRYTSPVQGLGRTVMEETQARRPSAAPRRQGHAALGLGQPGRERVRESRRDGLRAQAEHLGFGHGPAASGSISAS